MSVPRRYPIGAETLPGGGVSFRVWAARRKSVEVVLESGSVIALEAEPDGYFSGICKDAAEGSLYRFRLDGGDSYPDPASRFQPEGPHGPSEVIDPSIFRWTDRGWAGCSLKGQVIYELHVGTFTPAGTWDAARRELQELAELGVTVVELMPVSEFPGRFGWGYDGVGLYAPYHIYGTPDDFRRFVDHAHSLGIGVILDAVYNHVGPDGNYLSQFSEDYFTDRYTNEWGQAINFDGDNSAPVREWVVTNAAYWAEEFHLDGLRLDATQQICDCSTVNIQSELAARMRACVPHRKVFIVAENEPQHTRLIRPVDKGGYGLDGLWNDDFHHSARVAMTGHHEAYYTDYQGKPQELISAVKYGYLFQGQRYTWQAKRRGMPAWGSQPWQFITYIQNHDQVANSGRSERVQNMTSPGRLRAMTALLLLAPGTPMLFQGQEFAASNPFYYFADHEKGLRRLVWEGRIQSFGQFPSLAQPEMRTYHVDPGDPATFQRSKLNLRQRESHHEVYLLHKDLLRLRREETVFRAQRPGGVDGAVLAPEAFLLRFFSVENGTPEDERLLIVNFGNDLTLDPAPEPLLAPLEEHIWTLAWSSEAPRYGGCGTAPVDSGLGWRIPGHAAVVLKPAPESQEWTT